MSSRLRPETFPANGRVELGPGNFFFLLDASANINVQFNKGGTSFGAENVGGGYLKANREGWRSVVLTAAAGTTVEFFYGDEDINEDTTDYRQVIASITGDVSALPRAATFTTPAKAAVAAAASVDIAADLTRKRITITAESDNTNSFWVRDQAGVTDAGYEVQPGQSVTIYNTAALRIRNNGAASCDYTTITET